jgi:colanic acid/amylovoran biosynthesis glycosyltransferase
VERIGSSLPLTQDPILGADYGRFPGPIQKRLYHLMGLEPLLHKRAFSEKIWATDAVLVHAHFATDAVSAMPLSAHLQVPLVVTLHGYDVTTRDAVLGASLAGRAYLTFRRRLWRSASAFICVSDFIRRKAIEAGFPEHKLCVHHIGVDCEAFAPSDQQRQKNLILFVGRLVEKKGCEYVIRAVAELQKQQERAELVVIGDGPLRPSLEALSQELGLTSTFLGSQPGSVISRWLKVARVFCAPSITAASGDAEGLGLVFAEAQSSGTPVVSSFHGGVPEVVRHDETGLLAPERDYQMLAEHLRRYLTDDRLWRESSARGVEWIRERFNLSTQTRSLEEIYQHVLDN